MAHPKVLKAGQKFQLKGSATVYIVASTIEGKNGWWDIHVTAGGPIVINTKQDSDPIILVP